MSPSSKLGTQHFDGKLNKQWKQSKAWN